MLFTYWRLLLQNTENLANSTEIIGLFAQSVCVILYIFHPYLLVTCVKIRNMFTQDLKTGIYIEPEFENLLYQISSERLIALLDNIVTSTNLGSSCSSLHRWQCKIRLSNDVILLHFLVHFFQGLVQGQWW